MDCQSIKQRRNTTTSNMDDPGGKSNSDHMNAVFSNNKVEDFSLYQRKDSERSTSDLEDRTKDVKKRSIWTSLIQLSVCLTCGVLFGIALEKSRVFEPRSIREQMVFRKFIMLKMFLAAAASGQVFLAILSLLPITRERFREASAEYVSCLMEKGLVTSTIGPFILGAGMTVSGACPGMVLAQVGAWVPNAIFTLLGALIGALLYGLVAPKVIKLTRPQKQLFREHQVYKQFNLPFAAVAIPLALVMGCVVFIMEYFWPWTKDLDVPNLPNTNIATVRAWTPYAAGILIGFLQIPLVLVIRDTMGGSSSYVTIVSQWVVTDRLQELFPYLAKMRCGMGNWWQVLYVGGAILGGTISSLVSGTITSVPGVSLPAGLLGGMLLLIGARLGAGCTSGHGLSGMGLLAWLSFVAVPMMFAGAIVTGFSMQATGALDHYVNLTFQS